MVQDEYTDPLSLLLNLDDMIKGADDLQIMYDDMESLEVIMPVNELCNKDYFLLIRDYFMSVQ